MSYGCNVVFVSGKIIGILDGIGPMKFWIERSDLDNKGKLARNRFPCTAPTSIANLMTQKNADVGSSIVITGKLVSDPLTQTKNILVDSFLLDGDVPAFYELFTP